jgi:hypothetical protein
MPRIHDRQQEGGAESQESILGEGVPVDGVEAQAARRAHMREQTTARQAAERHLGHPLIPAGSLDHHHETVTRVAEVREELARINADHQVWLHDHGREGADALPNDYQAPE